MNENNDLALTLQNNYIIIILYPNLKTYPFCIIEIILRYSIILKSYCVILNKHACIHKFVIEIFILCDDNY